MSAPLTTITASKMGRYHATHDVGSGYSSDRNLDSPRFCKRSTALLIYCCDVDVAESMETHFLLYYRTPGDMLTFMLRLTYTLESEMYCFASAHVWAPPAAVNISNVARLLQMTNIACKAKGMKQRTCCCSLSIFTKQQLT